MRVAVRSLGTALLAILGTVVLAVAWTTATAVQLAATALIMGGTEHPLAAGVDDPDYIEQYLGNAIVEFINPASVAPTGTGGDPIAGVDLGTDDVYAVIYPAQFFPVFGSTTFDDSVAVGVANLNGCVRGTECTYNEDVVDPPSPPAPPLPGGDFVIFGYSQSAVVASFVKADLIANPPPEGTKVSFFFLANPKRPNGGFLSRGPEGLTIPILGVTFSAPTPTNSCEVGECFESADLARQYDGLGGDAAVGLTNLPAVLNAALGYVLLHGDLQYASFSDALYQGSYGDTDYYLVPSPRLPLLMPFDAFVPSPILTAIDTILRPVIEGGYRRDINPGVPVSVSLLPFHNPVQTLVNVLVAIPTGIDDAIAEATNDPANRPLGTKPVTSPYGVGGPELPEPPTESLADDDSTLDANDEGAITTLRVGKSAEPAQAGVDDDAEQLKDARQKDESDKQEGSDGAGQQTEPETGAGPGAKPESEPDSEADPGSGSGAKPEENPDPTPGKKPEGRDPDAGAAAA